MPKRFTDRLFRSVFPSAFPYQYPSFAIAVQVVPRKGKGYIAPNSPHGTAYGQAGRVHTDAVRGVKEQV